jgi:DNA helicase-2/ATP-dependent DNA helicase PcrA
MRAEIPFIARSENVVNLFEHWIFKDIVNFYDLSKLRSLSSAKKEQLVRGLKRPTRYVSSQAFKSCKTLDDFMDWGFTNKKPYLARNIQEFKKDIRALKKTKSLSEFLNYLLYDMDYEKAILDYADYNCQSMQDLMNVLNEIIESSKEFKTFEDWYEYAKDYTFTLETSAESEDPGVHLLTMHSSKGLEFQKVYIIDANEGFTPYAYRGVVNDEGRNAGCSMWL